MLSDEYEALDEVMLVDNPDLADSDRGGEQWANRRLRAIARLRRQLADAEQVALGEIDRVKDWLDARRAALSTEHLELELRGYHEARLADDPKVLTIDLPNGTLASRAGQPTWSINEETFIEWAARNRPHLLVETIKTTVAKAEVKKVLTIKDDGVVDPESGELVPGVTITPAERTFTVKTTDGSAW